MVCTAEDVLAKMEEHGVDQTSLIAPPIHGRGRPYTRECLRTYPDRFYGINLLDYFSDDITERVHEALNEENLLEFRFGACFEYDSLWEQRTSDADWITDGGLSEFWTAIEAYDSPQVQIMLEPKQFEQAEELVASRPNVTFVLDHLGWPTPSEHRPEAVSTPYSRRSVSTRTRI